MTGRSDNQQSKAKRLLSPEQFSRILDLETDNQVAHHEAAHCVVAVDAGWPFEWVSIDRQSRESTARGWFQPSSNPQSREDLEHALPVMLAGQLGERTLSDEFDPHASAVDIHNATWWLRKFVEPEEHIASCAVAMERARVIINSRLPALSAVASTLLVHRRLTQDQVIQVMQRAERIPSSHQPESGDPDSE